MDIKDEASIINSDENVVSDVEQADLSINGDDSYTIYPNAEVRVEKAQYSIMHLHTLCLKETKAEVRADRIDPNGNSYTINVFI